MVNNVYGPFITAGSSGNIVASHEVVDETARRHITSDRQKKQRAARVYYWLMLCFLVLNILLFVCLLFGGGINVILIAVMTGTLQVVWLVQWVEKKWL